jgi:hypothetical protein
MNKGRRLSKDFWEYEFRCKHCGLLVLHPGFIDRLQTIRDQVHSLTGRGMVITSGCRCQEHNAAVKGHSRSLHIADIAQHPGQLGTLGVDVATPTGFYRGILFIAAWSAGFSIGWNAARGFLHLDWRTVIGLPQTSFDY